MNVRWSISAFLQQRRLKTAAWLIVLFVALLLWGDRLVLSSPNPHLIRFAHTYTTASERAIVDAAVVEFELSHPGVKIEQIVSNSDVYQTIGWRLQFRGRKQPDIYFHWRGFKVDYAIEQGWALNLAPYLSASFLDEFVPAAVAPQRGGIYHLPQSVDISNLIWYNRSFFETNQLAEPASIDSWVKLCEDLRKKSILPLAQGNRDLWPMGNFGAELLGQTLGGESLKRLFQPGENVQSSELRGLKAMERLLNSGSFEMPGVLEPGAINSFSDIDAKVLFLNGKAAQHIVGSWFLADIRDAENKKELRFEVGVAPVPAAEGETNAMVSVTTGYLVNPKTKNPAAVTEFLELLLSRKYQSRFAELGNLSARRDAAAFTVDPLTKRLLQILASAPAMVPPPDTGYAPEQANVFYELCARMLSRKLELKDAASYWMHEKMELARKGL